MFHERDVQFHLSENKNHNHEQKFEILIVGFDKITFLGRYNRDNVIIWSVKNINKILDIL